MDARKGNVHGTRAATWTSSNGGSPGDDLAKKIAESTQLEPKDVQAVFAAMQTIAYAELQKKHKLVLPGFCQLKARRVRKERHKRVLIFGNFRLEGQD